MDKRKQTLTPPFTAVFYTPLCNPLIGRRLPKAFGKDTALKTHTALTKGVALHPLNEGGGLSKAPSFIQETRRGPEIHG